MTRHHFMMLCGELLIDPGLALENDALCAALAEGDDEEVERILTEEF